MKVMVLYRPKSEHARNIDEFIRELKRREGDEVANRVELINIDTRDGAATASLYGVMQYPAVLAIQNDGSLLKDWQGSAMPLLNEVSYYTHA